ncbi:MFS transporter [Streptomyces sp. NPDC059355]|uniref:MFS transporter n=1 Tax=Streptomyces sp. NPDC059355 TaxID=3346811 RepID=UPI00369ADE78
MDSRPAEASRTTGALSPLRLRGFRHLAMGQLVSSLGNAMYKVAQSWLLAASTGGNGSLVGLLAAFQLGPLLLFGGRGGRIADQYQRRRLLIATQSAHAALSAMFAVVVFLGPVRVWQIYLLTFAAGLVTVVDNPARQRFLTDLVGETRLSRALGLYTALLNTGQILGPLVAGLIVGWAHVGWIFVLDAATFTGMTAVLLTLPDPATDDTATAAGVGRGGGLRDALAEAGRVPRLAAVVLASGVVGSIGVQFTLTNTLMATRAFGLTATGFASLAMAVTVGCLLGALVAGRAERPSPVTVLAAAAGTGLTGAVCGLAPNYPVFVVLLVPAGFASMLFTTCSAVLLQLCAAPGLRGRVIALQTTVFYGSGLVGALLLGVCADRFGPRAVLVGAGVATMAACAAIGAHYRTRLGTERR